MKFFKINEDKSINLEQVAQIYRSDEATYIEFASLAISEGFLDPKRELYKRLMEAVGL